MARALQWLAKRVRRAESHGPRTLAQYDGLYMLLPSRLHSQQQHVLLRVGTWVVFFMH